MILTRLVQVHHAAYTADIPFWLSGTDGLDPVLELGCGAGRVTLPLAKSGRTVVGLDLNLLSVQFLVSELLNCEENIQNRVLALQADMLNFWTDCTFRSVILPCNTYSIFTPGERQLLLNNITRSLQPDGLFITSLPNPHRTAAIHKELLGKENDSAPDFETEILHPETENPVQVSSLNSALSDGVRWDWIYDHLFPDGRVERLIQSTEHKLCSPEIYLNEFKKAGLKEITCLGDFNGKVFKKHAPYLILIGKKLP
ncbi:MAG: class I SAM-dependent methyltransferase [Anaerolineales bacterium]